MKAITLVLIVILISNSIFGQKNPNQKFDSLEINCDDLLINDECQLIYKNAPLYGPCNYYSKKHVIVNRSYFTYGLLDSVRYLDKSGNIEIVELYQNDLLNGTSRYYYKNGFLKASITFRNDTIFGLWRRYRKNGKIKYEAEYIVDGNYKDDSYYTWDKKERKYLHSLIEIDKTKRIGKIQIDSGYSRWKKSLVTSTP